MLVPEWTKGGDPAPSGQRVDPESLSLPIDSSEGMLLITRIILDYIQQEQGGFIEPIAKELPLEYAVELNRLIELEMEGFVG